MLNTSRFLPAAVLYIHVAPFNTCAEVYIVYLFDMYDKGPSRLNGLFLTHNPLIYSKNQNSPSVFRIVCSCREMGSQPQGQEQIKMFMYLRSYSPSTACKAMTLALDNI